MDKKIREFKDLENNTYKIYKKPNNHYYLTIKKPQEEGARIIEGSKNKIFYMLQEIHKTTSFVSIGG